MPSIEYGERSARQPAIASEATIQSTVLSFSHRQQSVHQSIRHFVDQFIMHPPIHPSVRRVCCQSCTAQPIIAPLRLPYPA